jgi:hypothetical protein
MRAINALHHETPQVKPQKENTLREGGIETIYGHG